MLSDQSQGRVLHPVLAKNNNTHAYMQVWSANWWQRNQSNRYNFALSRLQTIHITLDKPL